MKLNKLFSAWPKVCVFFTVLCLLAGASAPAMAQPGSANNVKIVAVYGAGNLSGSEYDRDTIILFNPTTHDIDMTGWTIQGVNTSGTVTVYTLAPLPAPTTATVVPALTPTIKAGSYYAIAGSGLNYDTAGNCKGANCFQADSYYDAQLQKTTGYSNTDNDLASTPFIIGLASNSTAISATCSTALASSSLVDLVGIEASDGSTPVVCYAGGGPAPQVPTTLNGGTTLVHGVKYPYATVRRNRCIDTGNNDADFALGYFTGFNGAFPNASAPAQPCPTGSQLDVHASAFPSSTVLSGTTVITAKITPSTSPASGALTVTVDLTSLGTAFSATTPMYDDGTHGDQVAGDGVYTASVTLPSALPTSGAGIVPGIIVTATDANGNKATNNVPLSIGATATAAGTVPGPGNNNLEIVAWYGAGDLAESQYARDTIILFNPTPNPITMNNWSIQTGSGGAFTAVNYKLPVVTIPSGAYYAIAGSGVNYIQGVGCTSTNAASPCSGPAGFTYDYQLKTVEGTETSTDNDLTSTATTVALVNNQTALGSDCPVGSPHLVDLLSVSALDGSSTSTCWPGTGPGHYTPTDSASTTLIAEDSGVIYEGATVRTNRCNNHFDNALDFTVGLIDWKNSSSVPQPCGVEAQQLYVSAAATPNAVGLEDSFTITATVTPASNSTNVAVTADLSELGLSSAVPLTSSGNNVFTVTTAAASGAIGLTPALDVTATDAQGNLAKTQLPLTINPGILTLTSSVYTATVKSGGVAVFPLTLKGTHGYTGLVTIGCTGSPNTNNLGVPVSMQCITTPPEITLAVDGTATCQLGISAGTTYSAGLLSRSLFAVLATMLSLIVLGMGIWRRKQLPAALIAALLTLAVFNATGCATDAGLQNTGAAPGTYTFVVTAQDTATAGASNSISSTINLTVIVQ